MFSCSQSLGYMISLQIIEPSKEVALQLLESGGQNLRVRKLGLDMLRQLSLHHEYISSLVQDGYYLEALRYAQKRKVQHFLNYVRWLVLFDLVQFSTHFPHSFFWIKISVSHYKWINLIVWNFNWFLVAYIKFCFGYLVCAHCRWRVCDRRCFWKQHSRRMICSIWLQYWGSCRNWFLDSKKLQSITHSMVFLMRPVRQLLSEMIKPLCHVLCSINLK